MRVIALILLIALCYAQGPRCTYNNGDTDFSFDVNQNVEIIPSCLPTPTNAASDPALPTGLYLGTDGSIKGAPTSALPKTTYTITFTGPTGDTSTTKISMSVTAPIQSCTYGVSDRIQIPINTYTIIQGPKCDPEATSFERQTNNIPAGMTLDPVTGAISGTPTTTTKAITIVVKAINSAGTLPVSVNVIVVDNKQLPPGIMARISPSEYGEPDLKGGKCPETYDPYLYDFENGNMNPITTYYFSELDHYCYGDCPAAFPAAHYFTRYDGIIHAPVTGTYSFRIRVDDCVWMFLDNNYTHPVAHIGYSTDGVVVRVPMTEGDHAFTALHYEYDGATRLYMEWKIFSAGIMYYEVLGGEFISGPQQPVQFLTYPSSDYIVRIYTTVNIRPSFEGSPTEWFIEPDLPAGLEFNKGAITGKPTETKQSTRYKITAKNGVSTTTADVYLTVVQLSTDILKQGIMASYYSCSSTSHGNVDSCQGQVLVAKHVVAAVNREKSSKTFDGLISKYGTNLKVVYEGYINFPNTGSYIYGTDVLDAGRAKFTSDSSIDSSEVVAQSTCSTDASDYQSCTVATRTDQKTIVTSEGPRSFEYTYLKSNLNSLKQVQVFWSGGPNMMEKNYIPADYYYYLPSSSLSYDTPVAIYMSQIQLEANRPIIFMSNKVYQSFSIYPTLPAGLRCDSRTGIISGTPTVDSSYRTKYTVTATSTDRTSVLTATVEIEVIKYVAPIQIDYTGKTVSGKIGEPISTVGPTTAPDGVNYYVEGGLPLGLSVDSATGAISGTPLESASGTFTIFGQSDGGVSQALIPIQIDSCDTGKSFVRMVFTTGANLDNKIFQRMKIASVGGQQALYGEGSAFGRIEKFGCINDDVYEVTLGPNKYSVPGEYWVYGEGTSIYRYGKYILNDKVKGEDDPDQSVVRFTVTIGSSSTPVIEYPDGDNGVYTIERGIGAVISPVISYGADYCSINPPNLPDLLVFENKTGTITGNSMYNDPSGLTFSITCTNKAGSGTASLTIKTVPCPEGSFPAVIAASSTGSNGAGWFAYGYFYKGLEPPEDKQDYIVYWDFGIYPYTTTKRSFCMYPDNYTLSLWGGWGSNALTISLADGETIYNGNEERTQVFDVAYLYPPNSAWEYSPTTNNRNWYNNFKPGEWESYVPGSFPERGDRVYTTYYRTTFTIPEDFDIRKIAAFEAGFKYDAGIVAYLNNKEFYRRNVPQNQQANTYATEIYTGNNIMIRRTGASADILQNGVNYIAAEVHKHRNSVNVNPFAGFFNYIVADCNRRTVRNMEVTNNFGAEFVYPSEPLSNWVDGSRNTKGYVRSGCNPVQITFMWPNGRSEFFNKYTLTSGDMLYNGIYPYRVPFAWDLYATTDNGKTWILLDSQNEIIFRDPDNSNDETNWQAKKVTREFYIYGVSESFDGVMINFTTTGIPGLAPCQPSSLDLGGLELMEATFDACNNKLCAPEGKWTATVAGSECVKECPEGYSGKQTRMCNDLGGTPTWGSEPVFSIVCSLKMISNFVITNGTSTIYKDFDVSGLVPSFSVYGAELEYAITPSLETTIPGLKFNTSTGEITGTPKAEMALTTFRVTVTNPVSDELYGNIYIRVDTVRCMTDGSWPATEQGKTVTIQCTGSTRTMTRRCTAGMNPHWETLEDNCSKEEVVSKKTSTAVIVVASIAGVIFLLLIGFCVYARASSAKKRATRRGMRTAQAQAAKAAMEAREKAAAGGEAAPEKAAAAAVPPKEEKGLAAESE